MNIKRKNKGFLKEDLEKIIFTKIKREEIIIIDIFRKISKHQDQFFNFMDKFVCTFKIDSKVKFKLLSQFFCNEDKVFVP